MPPSFGRSGLPFSLRSFAGLLLVGVLVLPMIAWSNNIEIRVDGEPVSVRTYAQTVGGVLNDLDLEVAHGDVLSHHPDAALEQGMEIELQRAATIDIHVDGLFAQRVVAPVTSVAGVLAEAGMDGLRAHGAETVPDRNAPIEDGDVINVWTAQHVSVAVDGERLLLSSLVRDVDALLIEEGIELGPDDVVSVSTDAWLAFVDEVLIERVEYVEELEEVIVERDEERRESSELPQGTSEVHDEGVDGLRVDTYRVTLVDGEAADRELISEEILEEPSPRVVLDGTQSPPSSQETSSSGSGTSSSSSEPATSSSKPAPAGAPSAGDPVWDRLAQCESNGNWQNVSGNGMYYGGLQFHPDTWRSVGGSGMPHEASRSEQIYRAQILQARSGWGQWPACSRSLGLR